MPISDFESHHTIIQNLILQPVQLGALTLLYAGTAPEAASLNGKVCTHPLLLLNTHFEYSRAHLVSQAVGSPREAAIC